MIAGLTVVILAATFGVACKVWTRLGTQDKQR